MVEKRIITNHIAIEGIDGSGKSTMWNYLKNNKLYLEKSKIKYNINDIIFDTSPFDPNCTTEIREMLKDFKHDNSDKLLLKFMEDHAIHSKAIDEKLLEDSYNLIVSDRYIASTLAYQSLNTDFSNVSNLYESCNIQIPGIIIYFDVSTTTAMDRINLRTEKNKEIFEDQKKLIQLKVNYAIALDYLKEISKNKISVIKIDANKDIDTVKKDIKLAFDNIMMKINRLRQIR